jgi:hypothetical protein
VIAQPSTCETSNLCGRPSEGNPDNFWNLYLRHVGGEGHISLLPARRRGGVVALTYDSPPAER